MEPTTLLIAATAIQAVGAISSANSQAAALTSQAQASDYNAAVSRQQAEQALQVSTAQQLQSRRESRQFLGRQRAAAVQATGGVKGSAGDILEQSETLAELDALNIAYEGSLRSKGYSTQADLDNFYSRAYSSQAKSTRRSGLFSAAGSVGMGAYNLGQFPARRTTIQGPSFNVYGGRTAFA